MNEIVPLSSSLVLLGAVFMLAAIIHGLKIRQTVPEEIRRKWRIMTLFMIFFLIGYFIDIIIVLGNFKISHELITSLIFLAGAFYVFIVVGLTRTTIGRMRSAEENLLLLNVSLEQRVIERTDELRSSYAFFKTVLDSLNDEVIIIDVRDFRIVGTNTTFLNKNRLKEENVIGRGCYEVLHHCTEPCASSDNICPLREAVETGGHAMAEHVHYDKEGGEVYLEVSASPIIGKDGKVDRVVHVSKDITERRRAEDEIRKLNDELELKVEERTRLYEEARTSSLHDPLTKLSNRSFLEIELEKLVESSKRYGTPLSVIMADIDHFKKCNDMHGHFEGDRILVKLANVFLTCTRNPDYVFRYGGEEFLFILPNTDLSEARRAAARLRKAVESQMEVTISLGVASYHKNLQNKDCLIKRADEALYLAKQNGRNRVEVSDIEQEGCLV